MTQSDTAHQSASTNTRIKTGSVQKTEKHELYATAQTVDWQPQRRLNIKRDIEPNNTKDHPVII